MGFFDTKIGEKGSQSKRGPDRLKGFRNIFLKTNQNIISINVEIKSKALTNTKILAPRI